MNGHIRETKFRKMESEFAFSEYSFLTPTLNQTLLLLLLLSLDSTSQSFYLFLYHFQQRKRTRVRKRKEMGLGNMGECKKGEN